MPKHATPDDCPCCFDRIMPGDDTDTALITSFIGGVMAVQTNTPMAEALCAKHAALVAEALTFTMAAARAGLVPR